MKSYVKYIILSLITIVALNMGAQTSSSQAVVTVIGDPVQSDDVVNNNPYVENSAPPEKQKIAQPNNIEPTLDNGFHIRFEIGAEQQYINHGGSSSYSAYASSGSSFGGKAKKHGITMTERVFNIKKRIKSWLPEHKKRYRPHLCGRF